MDLGIKGKRAVVFGASSGLGKAVAKVLIDEGAKVVIAARGPEKLKKTAQEIGASFSLTCDLAKGGEAKRIIESAAKALGGVDILVTNTGGPPKGNFQDISLSQWSEGFQSLWLSTVEAMGGALSFMKEQRWGRILLITSVAAREPMTSLTVSNGLRAGLLGLTKSLSQEVAKYGVTVNALLPGYTDTERLQELGIPEEKMTSQIPAGRLGQPLELGALAAFLASQQAGYITGQAIACDGGYLKGI